MRFLRQSTAATVLFGPFVQPADGVTPVTTLTDQAAAGNGRISKNGTDAALASLASWSHQSGGDYAVGLAAGHVDTPGRLRIRFSLPATYLPVWETFAVLPAAVYDWLFGAGTPVTTANLPANFVALAITPGGGVSVASNGDKAGYALATAPPTAAEVWAHATRSLTDKAGFAPTAADVWSHATRSLTDKAGFAPTAAEVWTHEARALTDKAGFALATPPPDAPTIAAAVRDGLAPELATVARLDDMTEADGPAWRLTAAALSQAPTGGGGGTAPTVQEIVAGVWDAPRVEHTAAGSFGSALDATVSSRSTYAGADTPGTVTLLQRADPSPTLAALAPVGPAVESIAAEVAAIRSRLLGFPAGTVAAFPPPSAGGFTLEGDALGGGGFRAGQLCVFVSGALAGRGRPLASAAAQAQQAALAFAAGEQFPAAPQPGDAAIIIAI